MNKERHEDDLLLWHFTNDEWVQVMTACMMAALESDLQGHAEQAQNFRTIWQEIERELPRMSTNKIRVGKSVFAVLKWEQ
jgi:hypothetical protein